MSERFPTPDKGNVVSLAAFRRQRRAGDGEDAAGALPCPLDPGAQEIVVFVTGGRFECMVNGSVATLRAGQFCRIPAGAAHGTRDIGPIAGSLLEHRFPPGLDAGLYRELAAALPPFTRRLPPRRSQVFRQLQAIARRWGVELESGAAA